MLLSLSASWLGLTHIGLKCIFCHQHKKKWCWQNDTQICMKNGPRENIVIFLTLNALPRGPTEDIIHYFTLMSSELHYLDIILKIENLTLMSSASGKFDINVLSIWENHLSNTHIFVILPVLFLFSHVLNASEQLQLLIYALLSLKCRELHLRVF